MRLDQILNSTQTPGKRTIQIPSEAEVYVYICMQKEFLEVSHLKQFYRQYGIRPATALSDFNPNPTAKPSASPSPRKK